MTCSLLMLIFYIYFLNIRPWSYNRETPFPEYKTMVFNLVPNLSTHEGHFSNIRPGLINGKNRYMYGYIVQLNEYIVSLLIHVCFPPGPDISTLIKIQPIKGRKTDNNKTC